jgi:hypothetical protein
LTGLSLPPEFTLAHYRLTLEALEPLNLPPFKGSALRGGFGHTFKRLACAEPWPCGERCQRGNACPYGYVFETSPPDASQVLRTFSEVPRPFVIQPPADRREHIPAGERLTFGLVLVGHAIDYLPYFVAVFKELGRVGLGRPFDTPQGRHRGKYRLLAVDGVSAPSSSKGEGRGEGGSQPIYRAEEDVVRPVEVTITGDAVNARVTTLLPNRITLDFQTPTRLKHGGRWVREGPPFYVLIKTLLGRISSLSYFHCGQQLEADFRGLIDRAAEGVRIAQCQTDWQDWSRFSGRQKQRVEMGGLVGRVTYEGDLSDYLPLLALGELVHVGKGTVFGNGKYVISRA